MNNNYRITTKTLAILPVQDLQYQSKIIEQEEEYDHSSSPFDIIKENCLHYGSSYEGRKSSIQYHLDFKQKTPIPIHPARNIYAFPTHSAKSFECAWLFFLGVSDIKIGQEKTLLQFTNGKYIYLSISSYIIQKQYDRTGMCKAVYDIL